MDSERGHTEHTPLRLGPGSLTERPGPRDTGLTRPGYDSRDRGWPTT